MNDPLFARSAAIGWIASLALHALAVLLAVIALAPLDTGFEFQVPVEVELGLVEATEIEPAASAPPELPPAPEVASPSTTGGGTASAATDASVPADAGPPADAARRRRRDAAPDAGPLVAGLGVGPPVAFLPAGAQLALRIDMDRIRSSPLVEEVRGLLRVVPDWQALLGDSGVDPVRDLSRVLIATPNLQRSRIVVAGRLSPEAADPRAIAEQLATAQGVAIAWRDESGLAATRWPSPDGIERDVALIGDRHFVIARGEDLPRVLAIAAARRGRRAPPTAGPADALLSMEAGEGLSVEIENVAAFVRRSPCSAVPLRLRVGVIETPEGVAVRGEARFERAEDAEEARTCLGDLASRASRNVIVALSGLAGPLERLDLTSDAEVLHAETAVSYPELRTMFGLLRGLLEPARGAPPGLPPPTLPPPSPSPPPLPPAEPPPSPFE